MSYTRNAFEYLEESAKRLPDKVAFADAARSFTFAEFHTASLSVGTAIRSVYSGKRGNAVVLCDRNALSLLGMFGTMAAGLTYVPVDVKMPDDRLKMVLDTVSPAAVLCCSKDRKTADRYADYAPVIENEKKSPRHRSGLYDIHLRLYGYSQRHRRIPPIAHRLHRMDE